jgi:predicted neuraminidase
LPRFVAENIVIHEFDRSLVWTVMHMTVLAAAVNFAVPANAAEPGVVQSEFVFETAPFPQCHASTIEETKHGLVAAWFGGKYEKHREVGIWVARLRNGKWTKPLEVANGSQPDGKRYPCWNPVLFQPKTGPLVTGGPAHPSRTGPLMLFYKVGPSPSTWWGMRMTSTDGGKTWSKSQRLPKGILGPIKNKPIQLADGTILSGSSTEHRGWRVHFERSTDGGKTWTLVGPINDGKKFGVIQPTILRHGKRLQALFRSRQRKIVESWSDDGGKTWTELKATALPNNNSGIDGVTLKVGRHLLVYNHTTRGRGTLNVAVSKDGKTWQAAARLENEPGQEFSYPAVIQTSDGKVHITYTWKRRRVKHVVLDPAKLKPRAMSGGEWPATN